MDQQVTDETISKIEAMCIEHENALHLYRGEANELHWRVERILRDHKSNTSRALLRAKSFRDDTLVYFKALSMIADMAANASTHSEKNARLRGMIELLESGVSKLRELDFDENKLHWWYEDAFRSDNPTYQYVQRIHELESEVEALKKNQNGTADSE